MASPLYKDKKKIAKNSAFTKTGLKSTNFRLLKTAEPIHKMAAVINEQQVSTLNSECCLLLNTSLNKNTAATIGNTYFMSSNLIPA